MKNLLIDQKAAEKTMLFGLKTLGTLQQLILNFLKNLSSFGKSNQSYP